MIDKPTNEAGDRTGAMSGLLVLLTSSSLQLVMRFGLTGVTTTLAYFLLTNAFVLLLQMPPVSSSVCAYPLSVAISYLLQSRFTFRVKGGSLDQVARFLLTSLAGLVVSWCVMTFTILVHLSYLTGAIGICVIVPILNFFVLRGWGFAVEQTLDRALRLEIHHE